MTSLQISVPKEMVSSGTSKKTAAALTEMVPYTVRTVRGVLAAHVDSLVRFCRINLNYITPVIPDNRLAPGVSCRLPVASRGSWQRNYAQPLRFVTAHCVLGPVDTTSRMDTFLSDCRAIEPFDVPYVALEVRSIHLWTSLESQAGEMRRSMALQIPGPGSALAFHSAPPDFRRCGEPRRLARMLSGR